MTATPDPRSPGSPSEGTTEPTSEGPATPVDPTPRTSPSTEPASGSSEEKQPAKKREAGDPLRRSRTSGAYAALIAFAIVLVLLIIFIAQNTDSASVRYLGWEGSAPMAVLLLIATAAGMLLAGVAASARILQLRRRVKKERKK